MLTDADNRLVAQHTDDLLRFKNQRFVILTMKFQVRMITQRSLVLNQFVCSNLTLIKSTKNNRIIFTLSHSTPNAHHPLRKLS